jgi:metal-responsive CopG/Arc/MetJ family transcriptional regulator
VSKRFPISFKNTTKDIQLYEAIQKIEEQERSQIIKEILYKYLVEGKKYEK